MLRRVEGEGMVWRLRCYVFSVLAIMVDVLSQKPSTEGTYTQQAQQDQPKLCELDSRIALALLRTARTPLE